VTAVCDAYHDHIGTVLAEAFLLLDVAIVDVVLVAIVRADNLIPVVVHTPVRIGQGRADNLGFCPTARYVSEKTINVRLATGVEAGRVPRRARALASLFRVPARWIAGSRTLEVLGCGFEGRRQ
jgi:hypothetical protein